MPSSNLGRLTDIAMLDNKNATYRAVAFSNYQPYSG